MDEQTLTMIAGVVLSLAFSYIPGLRDWFNAQTGNTKRLIMLSAVALVTVGAFGLFCLGRYDAVACSADGAWGLIETFVLAAIANQTAYQLTPKDRATPYERVQK